MQQGNYPGTSAIPYLFPFNAVTRSKMEERMQIVL